MNVRKPKIEFHGPAAEHDQSCAVFHQTEKHAVLDMDKGIFLPSWEAQEKGWRLVQVKTKLQRTLLKLFFK